MQRVTGRAQRVRWARPALSRRARGALVVTVAALLGACSGGTDETAPTSAPPPTAASPSTTARARPDGPLRLGVVLPVTGAAASFGVPLKAGIDLAVAQVNDAGGVNGAPMEAVVTIDEGRDLATVGQTIVDGALDAIVGPASSSSALAIAEIVNDAQVVTCSPTAGSVALTRFGNRYVFRTIPSDAMEGAALAIAIGASGLGGAEAFPVAVLYPDDDYGRAIADRLRLQLNPQAARLVSSEPYDPEATESELDALAGQVVGTDPTVAVVIGLSDGGGRMLARLRAASGFARIERVYVSSAMREPTLFEKVAPGKADALLDVFGVSPLADTLVARFTNALRASQPDAGIAYAAYAYDCVNLIALAAQAAGSNDPRRFRDRLVDVSQLGAPCETFRDCAERLANTDNIDYDGVSGAVDIDASGDITSTFYELFGFDERGTDVRKYDFPVP